MPQARSATLQRFFDVTQAAIAARVASASAPALAMERVRDAVSSPRQERGVPPPSAPAVVDHLARALEVARRGPADVAAVADAVAALAPKLAWRQRDGGDAAFAVGHANTDFAGSHPNALEPRDDVWFGMSLVAPGVTYPDHRHPPEEVYLVLSGGDWRQEAGPWSTPGIGGIVYNPHNIVHAMRAGSEPLLAIWCLPIEAAAR